MNEQEFIEAMDAVLESYYRGQISPYEALNQISRLKGAHQMWKAGQQQ
jgi:hypothetical protein